MEIRKPSREFIVSLSLISAVMVPCLPALAIYIFPKFFISFGITLIGLLYIVYPIRDKVMLVQKVNAVPVLLLLAAFVIHLIFNHDLAVGDYQYTVYFFSWILIALTVPYIDDWIQPLVLFLMFASLIYVVFTFYFYMNEASYIVYVNARYGATSSGILANYAKGYMSGLLDNYSANGIMLSHAVGTCFCFSLYSRGFKKFVFQVFFVLSVGALLLTAKRGILIYTALAILAVIYFFYSNKILQRWIRIGLIIVVAVVAVIQISVYIPDLLNVFERFSVDRSQDLAMIGRDNLKSMALKIFQENPIMGIGWRGFMRGGYYADGDVHNVFLQLLCETGILGCTIYVLLFLSVYLKTITTLVVYRKRNSDDRKAGWQLAFSLYIQTVFILYCFSGNPLYDLTLLAPYFIGMWIVLYYASKELE